MTENQNCPELKIDISVDLEKKQISIDFDKPVTGIDLSPNDAILLSKTILEKIELIDNTLLPKVEIKKTGTLYSDGACSPNPGKGAYGSIFKTGDNTIVFSKGFQNTTNNRMELMGIIDPLEEILKQYSNFEEILNIKVVTDSQYVANAINQGWLNSWVRNNWKKSDGEEVKNADLWEKLYNLSCKIVLEFEWVKGHSENNENNKCDEIAVKTRQGNNLSIDYGYES